jgi:4-hydroxy-tetrahydrodipicolinate reductase
MINAIVAGAAGRMGKRLVAAVAGAEGFTLKGATERPDHPAIGADAGLSAGIGELGVQISADLTPLLKGADVIIEFTTPEATIQNLEKAASAGKAVVIGTTGLTQDERQRVEELAQKIPVLLAPNMSTGVNLLFHLVKRAAEILGTEYDLEILEAHHRMKKDAPSGTAKRLAEILAETRGLKIESAARYHREGIIGERGREEIGIQTIRAGDIVGEHTVIMAGPGERIELTHRAHTRDTFAHGAIRAARWIINQKPGLYSMQNLLGLE